MAWSVAVKSAVHLELLSIIDTGAPTTAPKLDIYDSGNVLLSTLPLAYPSGAVNVSGQLVMVFGPRDEQAAATGTASYAKFVAANASVLDDLIPCQAGSVPVSGVVVLSSLSIVAGAPVEGVSFVIG